MIVRYEMSGRYVCRIASLAEMERKWAYEIDRNVSDRENWTRWRETALESFREELKYGKQLYITFNLGFDPYCYNDQGIRINRTELKENKRLLRLSSTDVTIGLNWTLNQEFFKGKNEKKEKKQQEQEQALPAMV